MKKLLQNLLMFQTLFTSNFGAPKMVAVPIILKDLNITEASGANYNWTQATMYYRVPGATAYSTICGTAPVPCDKTNISAWEGVFIKVNQNNISLIRRN